MKTFTRIVSETCILTLFILLFAAANVKVYAADESSILVDFPDTNLKQALISAGVDKDSDGNITRGEMAALADPSHMGTGLGSLSLADKGITNITGIEYAVNITSLALDKNFIRDLSPLAGLTNLETLTLSSCNLDNISSLPALPKLRLLNLDMNNISDISPLSKLTNLQFLYLGTNNISDISPLANLTKLNVLGFFHNNLSDISALANLTQLWELHFGANRISDISPLANHPYLREIHFEENLISDISPLSGLTRLTFIDLYKNSISDISPLANLKLLNIMDISNNNISDISALSGLTELQVLDLNNNKISSIDSLASLRKLKRIGLENNSINDISAVANLNGLEELIIDTNNISDISPLSKLYGLKTLVLNINKISDITPISNLTALNLLRLSNNSISDIVPLSNLVNLSELYLDYNNISDVTPLTKLTKLRRLTLYKNKISDASSLSCLTMLTYIDIPKDKPTPPVVKNITSGSVYNTDRYIIFESGVKNGEGILNGKTISGVTVVKDEGDYTLVVTDMTGNPVTYQFRIDKTPPVITGVTQNGINNTNLTISYDSGTALLNNKPFSKGETVSDDGVYQLVVTDEAGNKTTINFSIDKTAPVVTGVTSGQVYNKDLNISFDNGTATLNNIPFYSGDTVSNEGTYKLTVTDEASNKTSIEFKIDKTAPVVKGVSNGAVYKTSVVINFNEGNATLNDKPFSNAGTVNNNGKYILKVTDKAGNTTITKFTIESSQKGNKSQGKVAAVTSSINPGSYNKQLSISLKCSTTGMTIYYTTDGTTPTIKSKVYSKPILVKASTTIKAIAVKKGLLNSDVVSFRYDIFKGNAIVVSADVKPGTYQKAMNVTLKCFTPGATIYYSIDGKNPSTASKKFTKPILINKTTTIKAIVIVKGKSSQVFTFRYIIKTGN